MLSMILLDNIHVVMLFKSKDISKQSHKPNESNIIDLVIAFEILVFDLIICFLLSNGFNADSKGSPNFGETFLLFELLFP